ncbi:histidine phosphatase family protein [Rhodococcus sp. BP-316]|uniref:histidine phosphatase family protein n=1 Tax=Rhodococcus sp. BP-316 TaxID=2739445 RepID=UPI001C9B40AA|nr:histidine phosphatase family protein [Rhodococcus sp. BP-316]MBY6683077.1 histidine phosphatase family protein [Rhodococcus sp. BP-316]
MIDRDPQSPFELAGDAVEIILVRHGSTAHDHDEPPVGGHADPPLSPLGRDQAQNVADVLRTLDPATTSLFVTTLQRTSQTAEPIASALGLEPTVMADLREIHLGTFEGSAFEERRRADDPLLREVFEKERWDLIPGAESSDTFSDRVRRGLDTLAESTPAGTTAVAFVHGGVVAEICHLVTESRPFAFIDVENGSMTRLVHGPDRDYTLRSFNDTSHLRSAIRTTGPPSPQVVAAG